MRSTRPRRGRGEGERESEAGAEGFSRTSARTPRFGAHPATGAICAPGPAHGLGAWPQTQSGQAVQPLHVDNEQQTPAMSLPTASLDVALIGNCAISALIDKRGAIVWCCMPRFDGDPIFHALLDSAQGLPQDGTLAIELEGFARSEQSYDHGTAVLRTRLYDAAGEGIEA